MLVLFLLGCSELIMNQWAPHITNLLFISKIRNVLDQYEVDAVRVSHFGKFVQITEKPPFSIVFLISRQLDVAKKHKHEA